NRSCANESGGRLFSPRLGIKSPLSIPTCLPLFHFSRIALLAGESPFTRLSVEDNDIPIPLHSSSYPAPAPPPSHRTSPPAFPETCFQYIRPEGQSSESQIISSTANPLQFPLESAMPPGSPA